MTEYEALERGFEHLREQCDPRGWELLDALKAVALAESVSRYVAVKTVEELDAVHHGFSVKV